LLCVCCARGDESSGCADTGELPTTCLAERQAPVRCRSSSLLSVSLPPSRCACSGVARRTASQAGCIRFGRGGMGGMGGMGGAEHGARAMSCHSRIRVTVGAKSQRGCPGDAICASIRRPGLAQTSGTCMGVGVELRAFDGLFSRCTCTPQLRTASGETASLKILCGRSHRSGNSGDMDE
jgi:hypothetical protein